MAPRLRYGSRPTTPKEIREDVSEKLAESSRGSSLTSHPSTVSKIPKPTSMFSRNKQRKTGTGTPNASGVEQNQTPHRTQEASGELSSIGAPKTKTTPASASLLSQGANFGEPTEPTRTATPNSSSRSRLRKKASLVDQHGQYSKSESAPSLYGTAPVEELKGSFSSPGGYLDPFPSSILGISVPTTSSSRSYVTSQKSVASELATSSSRIATYMSHQQSQKLSTQNLPPPTPTFAHSSSPSTRNSESPGPFSRTSTPTSISSHSPGLTIPPKSALRSRLSSPSRSRPPVTRRRIANSSDKDANETQGLPEVQETLTSSSSSSTVKGPELVESGSAILAQRVADVSPLPPTPPLRLSSKRSPKYRDRTRTARRQGNASEEVYYPEVDHLRRPAPSPPSVPQDSSVLKDASKIPPPRPSRDGTPSLGQRNPSPIIQSNLNHVATTGHTRRASLEHAGPFSGDDKSRTVPVLERPPQSTSVISKKPSRLPSPSPVVTVIPHSLQTSVGSRDQTNFPMKPPTRDPSPASASPAKSTSRFGLFSRRTKSPLETSTTEAREKSSKKGPAAGTGHEGYGKYARRGRSGSTSTSASRGRSSSSEGSARRVLGGPLSRRDSFSGTVEPEMDEFFRDRLEPVVISGGGAILENRNSKSEIHGTNSEESLADVTSDAVVKLDSGVPPIRDGTRETWAASTRENPKRAFENLRQSTEAFEPARAENNPTLKHVASRPTLATRRSFHRSQLFTDEEPLRIPAPIDTRVLASPPPVNSFDTTQSYVPRTDSSLNLNDDLSEGREGNWLKPKRLRKREQSPKKWNFFQRAHNATKRPDRLDRSYESDSMAEVQIKFSRNTELRSMPYYAMVENSDPDASDALESVFDRVGESSSSFDSYAPQGPDSPESLRKEYQKSTLLPSPPTFLSEFSNQQPSSPGVTLRPAETIPTPPLGLVTPRREPRLPQVGRIPRVVSKRDRHHNPPPQSFSRPFTQRRPVQDDVYPAPERALEGGMLVFPENPVLGLRTEQTISRPSDNQANDVPLDSLLAHNGSLPTFGDREFLTFPRKGSEVSGSSSSGIVSLAGMTSMLPPFESALSEDEIWNEYDELLDHVTPRAPMSRGSSMKRVSTTSPPRLRRVQNLPTRNSEDWKKESPVLSAVRNSANTSSTTSPRTSSSLSGHPKTANPQSWMLVGQSSTPMSFSDIFASYADRASSGTTTKQERSSAGSGRSLKSTHTKSASQSSHGSRSSRNMDSQNRHTQLMAQKTSLTPGGQKNLRFDALMTSRWLSFDRVLFSPVHDEIKNNRQDRILVIDGIGNDDWSSYCALSYPDATVYNLGTVMSFRRRDSDTWQPPSNHRQIHHASIAHPFPFPKGFFTAAVFRFPVASSETAYRNAVSECKRVLRPGGYLEMSILDIDLVNMGNRARRAIRTLKVRMQIANPDVSLKPASDDIQKMLGRRGFENLNRCMVGVPVAGSVSGSRAGSFDEKNRSLGEMLDDPSRRGDEGIAPRVAEVGRWWYSKCYERSVVEEGDEDGSLWADKALLKECEETETGFRMLVCYAQKPAVTRRRTVSV
ncbi:hypothetical protein MMC20_004605 [Loxospora ochrophaea]|nr:hypothetical protein [Loxospora ochrophaea]